MLDKALFNSEVTLHSYTSRVWRMVETQETAATLNIVDTMEEQALLEELLEGVKPPYREGTQGMHYLFKTAFRYPPLKYGSRFGTRLMPSFFYASEKPVTALAETAYYRFVFLSDMRQRYEKEIDSSHSMFCASVNASRCLDLTSLDYQLVRKQLIDPVNYQFCQAVGDWAINDQAAQLIRAESARLVSTCNVAIADPKVIRSQMPTQIQSWLCRSSMDVISFSSRHASKIHNFHFHDFCVNGTLPRPA